MKVLVYSYHLFVGAAMVKIKKKHRVSNKPKDKYKAMPNTYISEMRIDTPPVMRLNEDFTTPYGHFRLCIIDGVTGKGILKAITIGRPIQPTEMNLANEVEIVSHGFIVTESTTPFLNKFKDVLTYPRSNIFQHFESGQGYYRENEFWPRMDYFKTDKLT